MQELSKLGRQKEAVGIWHKRIALDTNNVWVRLIAGTELLDIGFHREAEQILREAIRIDPKFGFGYGALSWNLYEQGHLKDAIEHAQRAAKLGDSTPNFTTI